MTLSNIQSESTIIYEDDVVYYYFSNDRYRGDIEFSMEIWNVSTFLNIFNAFLEPLMNIKISLKPDRQEYDMWREYAILKIVNRQTGTSKNRERKDFEDLATIMSRLDATKERVSRQIEYMEKIKSKIPQVKKRLELLWHRTTMPVLMIGDGIMSLYTFSGEDYGELNILGDVKGHYTGFMDLSLPFFESIDKFSNRRLVLTNKRSTSKGEITRRVVEHDLRYGNYSNMLLYLIEKTQMGKALTLNRVELFDLLSNIRIFSYHSMITFDVYAGRRQVNDINLSKNLVTLRYKRNLSMETKFSIPASFLLSLSSILYDCTGVKLVNTPLGVVLYAIYDDYALTRVHIKPHAKELFAIYHAISFEKGRNAKALVQLIEQSGNLSIDTLDELTTHMIPALLFEGKLYYNSIQRALYYGELVESKYHKTKYKIGVDLRHLIFDFVKRNKNEYQATVQEHHMSITQGDDIRYNCSCGKICKFLIGFVSLLLEGALYE